MRGIIEQYFDQSGRKKGKMSIMLSDSKTLKTDFLEVSEEEESKEQTPAESDNSSIMTPRKWSEKEPKKVEHESQLHQQLGIPMKKLAKTGLIVKKQQKLNELAAKEEQRLKDLA